MGSEPVVWPIRFHSTPVSRAAFGEIAAADDEQAAGGIDDAPGFGVEGIRLGWEF
jgi:hypothetical protein